MAGLTQDDAETQLALWIAANTAVASGQSYELGDRKLTRADAAEIRRQIIFWDRKARSLAGNSKKTGKLGVPV